LIERKSQENRHTQDACAFSLYPHKLSVASSTWRPGPLIEVMGVETRVEWEADNSTNFLLCLPKFDWLLLLCRVIITNQPLVDREESSCYYLSLNPRVSLSPPPQSAVQVSMVSMVFVDIKLINLPHNYNSIVIFNNNIAVKT